MGPTASSFGGGKGRRVSCSAASPAPARTHQLAATGLGRAGARKTRKGWTVGRRHRHVGLRPPSNRLPLPDVRGRPRRRPAPACRWWRRCWRRQRWCCRMRCPGAALLAGAAPAAAAAGQPGQREAQRGPARVVTPTGSEPASACFSAATAGRAVAPGLQKWKECLGE